MIHLLFPFVLAALSMQPIHVTYQSAELEDQAADAQAMADLSVRIVDQSGEPVIGARVELLPAQQNMPMGLALNALGQFPPASFHSLAKSESDSLGICAFDRVGSIGQSYALSVQAKGYVSQRKWIVHEDTPASTNLEIVLESGRSVDIKLVDHSSSLPIDGGTLVFYWWDQGVKFRREFSASNSNQELICVPADVSVHVDVEHDVYLDRINALSLEALDSLGAENKIRLERGREVEVLALNTDGTPLEGAEVFASQSSSDNSKIATLKSIREQQFRGRTDSAGRFLLTGVNPRRSQSIFIAVGDRVGSHAVTRGTDSVTIQLPEPAQGKWQFVDPSGNAVHGLEVILVAASYPFWSPVARAVTDAQGKCAFEVSVGEYVVYARNQEWSYASQPGMLTSGDSSLRRRVLRPAAKVELRAALAEEMKNGAPIAVIAGGGLEVAERSGFFAPYWARVAANLNAEQVRYLLQGRQYGGLLPGLYRLVVQADGCAPEETEVQLSYDKLVGAYATMARLAYGRVKVIDSRDEPVANARVRVVNATALSHLDFIDPLIEVVTGVDGVALLHQIKAGRMQLDVARDRRAQAESSHYVIEEGENDITVKLASELGGVRIVVDPRLMTGRGDSLIQLYRRAERGDSIDPNPLRSEALATQSTVEIADLVEGNYSVRLSGIVGKPIWGKVRIEEGQQASLEFSSEGRLGDSVEVVDSSGMPLVGAAVMLTPVNWEFGPTEIQTTIASSLRRSMHNVRTTKTGLGGVAHFESGEHGAQLAHVLLPGYQIESVRCTLGSTEAVPFARIQLKRAANLEVQLTRVDSQGERAAIEAAFWKYRAIAQLDSGVEYRLESKRDRSAFFSEIMPPGSVVIRIEERNPETEIWSELAVSEVHVVLDRPNLFTINLDS